MCAVLYAVIDHCTIDTQMVYQEEYLLMPAEDPEHLLMPEANWKVQWLHP